MIIDIVMPKMGESIIEGTILEWRKKVGEPIALDEILLEIGTDKVDSEIPSPNAGVVVEILGEVNQTMDVGAVIARIETDSSQAKPIDRIQVNDDLENKDKENLEPVKVKAPEIQTPKKKTINNIDKKKFFTPVVNKIAHENNINNEELLLIPGTGKSGRVTKLDILNYLKTRDDSIIQEIQPSKPSEPVTPSFTGNEAIYSGNALFNLL